MKDTYIPLRSYEHYQEDTVDGEGKGDGYLPLISYEHDQED